MAQLKDTVVSGNLRVTDTVASKEVQADTIKAHSSSSATDYTAGTSGQVLKSNGTSAYWAADNNTTYSGGTGISISSGTVSLASGVVTAGSAGPTAAVSGANTIAVPRITVDTYGRVTGLTSYNYTGTTDTNTWRPIGTGATDAAAGNHTHGISIATDSGTNALTMAANTKYKITAGGQSFIFTTPPDANTTYSLAGLMGSSAKGSTTQPIYWTGSAFANTSYTLGKSVPSDAVFTDTTYSSKDAASGGTAVSLVTTGEKYTWNNKSNLSIGTTASTAAAGNHTHSISIATSTGTNQITLAANTKYAITAGGNSYVFTTPPDNNSNTINSAGASNKTGTKMFLVGATSQTDGITSYSNSNCYIGTDNCLYSGGTKVLTGHQDISGKADKASITAGTAGTSSATSGSTLAVPYVTMNAQGIVTGYGTHTHTITGFLTSHQSLAGYARNTAIVARIPGSFTAAVNNYYDFLSEVGTMTVTLPSISNTGYTQGFIMHFTTSSSPALTFTSADSKAIEYYADYAIVANTTYEINCLFNGIKWTIAYAKIG